MERKYYFSRGTEQFGPLSLDELDNERVTPDMLFWYQGLPNWKKGHELPELSPIFKLPPPIPATPPPAGQTVTPPPLTTRPVNNTPTRATKTNATPWIIGAIVVLLGIFLLMPKKSEDGGSKNDAENLASKFTYKLTRATYPNTGREPTYQLTDWSYDDKMYELKLTAYWYGKCTMLAEDECQTGYDLTLNIAETGKVYGYTINGSNDCAKEHALCDIGMAALQGAIEEGVNVNQ